MTRARDARDADPPPRAELWEHVANGFGAGGRAGSPWASRQPQMMGTGAPGQQVVAAQGAT